MRTKDFFYDLPKELIAQEPCAKRDESRLLLLDRKNNHLEDLQFKEITSLIDKNSVLVLNNSKVIPARLFGSRPGKEELIEVLLIEPKGDSTWEAMVKPGKKMKMGTEIIFSDNFSAVVVGINESGTRMLEFDFQGDFFDYLEKYGNMPLPPYITKILENKDRYQTVYSKEKGSVAAPTAGLHFTDILLDELKAIGVQIEYLTLHVGIGTFQPVKVDNVENHKMHSEFYKISDDVAERINKAKKDGKKIVAVGTTTTRTLESVADENGFINGGIGKTDIFIYPGYKFKVIDELITNFHLPESTLMMLVSALYDKENIMRAYKHAIDKKYRFFSFGDAMYIR